MKQLINCCVAMCIFFTSAFSQDSASVIPVTSSAISNNAKDFYKISWKADAPITGAGLGLSALGLHLIQTKKDLDSAQLLTKLISNIPGFDRGNAGYYSEQANNNSYPPFFASFAMPVIIIVADKTERQQAGKILVMYTESLAITSAMFTMAAGIVDRSRPLVYGDDVPLEKRLSKNSQRSFYSGHVAATADATFFAAKVYSDLHPDSKFRPYLWAISAALPAVVGYYRYKAGEHFLSDNILGYVLGAGTGILVPALHKNKNFDRVSITPAIWPDAKGISIAYNF
jgi:membrane-associated phospholipid phosphatase